MKKLILLSLLALSLTGCYEGLKNEANKRGGYFISEKADYIVINTVGNKIMDIYKLKNCFVSENTNTDGLNFMHPITKTHITIQGDVKVLRNPNSELWDMYQEYHMDEEFCKKTNIEEIINKIKFIYEEV